MSAVIASTMRAFASGPPSTARSPGTRPQSCHHACLRRLRARDHDVALDRVLELLQAVRGDVLEGRDHLDAVRNQIRDQLGARALPDADRAHGRIAERGRERDAHRDHDLARPRARRGSPSRSRPCARTAPTGSRSRPASRPRRCRSPRRSRRQPPRARARRPRAPARACASRSRRARPRARSAGRDPSPWSPVPPRIAIPAARSSLRLHRTGRLALGLRSPSARCARSARWRIHCRRVRPADHAREDPTGRPARARDPLVRRPRVRL